MVMGATFFSLVEINATFFLLESMFVRILLEVVAGGEGHAVHVKARRVNFIVLSLEYILVAVALLLYIASFHQCLAMYWNLFLNSK